MDDQLTFVVCALGDAEVGKMAYRFALEAKKYLPGPGSHGRWATVLSDLTMQVKIDSPSPSVPKYIKLVLFTHDNKELGGYVCSGCDVIMLFYSCASKESFRSLEEFWIPQILNEAGLKENAQFIICGAKSDLDPKEEIVTKGEVNALARKIGAFGDIRISCLEFGLDNTKGNIYKAFRLSCRASLHGLLPVRLVSCSCIIL